MSKLNYLHHSSSRRSRSRSHHSSSHRSYHSSSHRSPSHQQHPSQYSTTNRNHVQQPQHYSSTKTTSQSNQLGQSQETYSTFHVHSSDYEMVFVNHETSSHTINKLLNHVNLCKQYSIDTESEKTNNQLSLIQINSIPFTPPSLVIHWSSSLTSRHSSLSHVTRMNMIHYVTHDVMAVTLLIRPITERWTFEKIKLRQMNEMFVAFTSIKLPALPSLKNKKIKNINMQNLATILRCNDPDVEDISSDDEIYLNQMVKPNDLVPVPVNNDTLHGPELLVNNHSMVVDVNDDAPTAPTTIRTKHQHRSDAARQRRNRKRNYIHRLHRYLYILVRRVYHRFTMSSIKNILRQRHISYRHVKIVASSLIIGIKNSTLQHEFDRYLPHDLFDREHYYYYRRRQQYHHHHSRHPSHHHQHH
ncbi:unnamed protein product [Rotaria magnacalcarata]